MSWRVIKSMILPLGIKTVEEAIPIENFMDVRDLCVLDFDRIDEVSKMRTV